MNRNYLPFITMLSAGVIISVITFIKNYSITNKIIALLLVMLIFYILGLFVKNMLNYFDDKNRKEALKQGEVIQKEDILTQEKPQE